MALINCPECGREISSLSKTCIHCGYPLEEEIANLQKDICLIDGEKYDLSQFKKRLCSADLEDKNQTNQIVRDLYYYVGTISIYAAAELCKIILNSGEVPKTYDGSRLTLNYNKDDVPICPKCGSTQISTGSRGYSLAWGFIGSGKTVNRCAKCGYKWTPKK